MGYPGTLTIAGSTFASLETGFTAGILAAGNYYPTGADSIGMGGPPSVGEPASRRIKGGFPGQAGLFTKDFSGAFIGEGTPVYADLIFAGTEAQCRAAFEAARALFYAPPRYSIVLPNGATFQGCLLKPGGIGRPRFDWINGTIVMFAPFAFEQLSATN
jgi:hypothetical protein